MNSFQLSEVLARAAMHCCMKIEEEEGYHVSFRREMMMGFMETVSVGIIPHSSVPEVGTLFHERLSALEKERGT